MARINLLPWREELNKQKQREFAFLSGGSVVIGDDQVPPTLNPYAPGGDNFIVSIIGQTYHAGVQEISGFTLELLPELVTELPTVANGGVALNDDGTMTVNYTIRDEALLITTPEEVEEHLEV
mgnify:CR=1 FL=1